MLITEDTMGDIRDIASENLKKEISLNGVEAKIIEECGELIQALIKEYKSEHIMEEMIDVIITILEGLGVYDEDRVRKMLTFKIARTRTRLRIYDSVDKEISDMGFDEFASRDYYSY